MQKSKPVKVQNIKPAIKTLNLSDIGVVTREMGDTLANHYYASFDLKVAQTSLKAYNTAINVIKTQLIYKKLTGNPKVLNTVE